MPEKILIPGSGQIDGLYLLRKLGMTDESFSGMTRIVEKAGKKIKIESREVAEANYEIRVTTSTREDSYSISILIPGTHVFFNGQLQSDTGKINSIFEHVDSLIENSNEIASRVSPKEMTDAEIQKAQATFKKIIADLF